MSISAVDYVNMASVSATLPIMPVDKLKMENKLAAIGEDVSHKQEAMTVTDVWCKPKTCTGTLLP